MSNEDQDILILLFGYILGKNSDKDELVCIPEYLTRLGWIHKTELEKNEQWDKVKIAQLEQENVKLKNEIRELRDNLESERDYADQMESKEMKAVTENAKLRKLVEGLWFVARYSGMSLDGATGSGFACQMRELGIEVN